MVRKKTIGVRKEKVSKVGASQYAISKDELVPGMNMEEEEKRRELDIVLKEIEKRKRDYGIISAKLDRIPQQKQLLHDIATRQDSPDKPRYFLYYGGNGAGKSFTGAYVTAVLALGLMAKEYGLPFLGWKKNIWVLTKSGSNVKSTIEPYLLGENSMTRIPPEKISKINKDNGILKAIHLTNGTIINVFTYDQGRENIQGGNPDWIWLDEEPVNEDVVTEVLARTRVEECEMLVTMTPLSGLTRIYEFFFNVNSDKVKSKSRVYLVSSLDNPFIDKTWAEGLTEDEYRLRVLGSFESPTGLVYSSFHRTRNVIPHIPPEELGDKGEIKYYRGIDFGVSHPTGVIFIAQDMDDNLYVWDEIKKSDTLIEDIANSIKQKSGLIDFEFTIRDSAAKREGIELAKYGIKTTPADKFSKGENDMSNRKAGIFLMNQLFKDCKLMISSNCTSLIKELETHYYKEGGKKDGEVNKVNDDLLDALRYIIFTIKKNQVKGKTMSQRKFDKEQFKKERAPVVMGSFTKF